MVDVFQVMIAHAIICKIHVSGLTTLVRNEFSCLHSQEGQDFSVAAAEILAKSFFVFPILMFEKRKVETQLLHVFRGSNT